MPATSRSGGRARSTSVRPPPFQVLLDEHRDEVYRFLSGIVEPHDLDDCFQETFLSALRAYPKLRDGSNPRSWIMTIAYRKAMDSHRGRARSPVTVEQVPERPARGSFSEDHALWELVQGLPPKQRAAVVSRYAHAMPYREIAGVIGITEEAARQNVREGLKSLRERIT
ncbi:MAG: RNA polymerase sigma factor [Actinomycetota bacterium]